MFQLYLEYEYFFAVAQLSLAMLGMGATLRFKDFAAVVKTPKVISVGLILQIICVPLVAALFLAGFELGAGVAIGIAMCAAIPGGTMSNVFTFLGRGHVALSIAMTGIATLACLVTTPVVLSLLIAQHIPAEFSMPVGDISSEIGFVLLLPLLIGMFTLKLFPAIAPVLSKLSIRMSVFVILLIVVGAMGAGRLNVEQFGEENILIVLSFFVVLTLISCAIPWVLRFAKPDITAINIEISLRNINLGVMINASLFPTLDGVVSPQGSNILFTLLVYGGAATIGGLVQLQVYRFLNRDQAVGV